MELAILFAWLVCGIVAGFIALARGASSCAGTIFGFLFGPLGILIACFLPSNKPTPVVIQGTAAVEPGAEKLCPHCRSYIPVAASVCRFCQREVSNQESH